MHINKIRGNIHLSDKKPYTETGEDDLVLVELELDKEKVPLVVSTYVLRNNFGDCAIECTIGQEQRQKGIRFTYLYATSVKPFNELKGKEVTDFDKTLISVGGRIIHMCRPEFIGQNYEDFQKIKVSSKNGGKGHLLLDITAVGLVARKMSSLSKYYRVKSNCFVKVTDGRIKFYAQSLSYKPPLPLETKKEE